MAALLILPFCFYHRFEAMAAIVSSKIGLGHGRQSN
jgi:hypothetical protein